MSTPLVVFVPKADREALRSAEVLPRGWFREIGPNGWGGDERCVRIWTEEPDWDAADGGSGIPPHPAQLLGLVSGGVSSLANEDLVAKLFGALVLNVVLLDGDDGGRLSRDATTGWVDVEPVLKAARWAKALNKSVGYWFAEEQSRNLRHAVLVIARGGRIRLSSRQLDALRAEFSDAGVMNVCYFLDFRLEVETGNDALHAECLWPIVAGRLLLRLLIALEGNGNDDILLPGVHLWRSFEFLFDYPKVEMTGMVTSALNEAYGKLAAETDAEAAAESLGKTRKATVIRNEDGRTFPGLPTELTQFGKNQTLKVGDWHRFPAAEEAEEIGHGDERRWGGRIALARDDFARRELELFREGDVTIDTFSPESVFPSVASDPRNVSIQLRRIDKARPTDTISGAGVYEKWKKVIEAEAERKKAKERLKKAGAELSLAQAHYVTAPYGVLVAIAISLLCGFTLFRAIWSLGGNGAITMAACFAALSAAGAFTAWGMVTYLHRRAGQCATRQFIGFAEDVDNCMDKRHEAAVKTIMEAETQHRTALRVSHWFALHRLLERVWIILKHELQSPSLSAFYRVDEPAAEPEKVNVSEKEARRQREVFLQRTRFAESLGAGAFRIGQRPNSDKVIAEALALDQGGAKSFRAFWSHVCDSADGNHRGDIPAQILIPGIRRWLSALCDRLCAAQKADLLAARGREGILPESFVNVRSDDGFILATAHVDEHEVLETPARVFVFDEDAEKQGERRSANLVGRARDLVQGAFTNIPVTATAVLNGLPQVAMYFQDIRLFGFDREEDGRLVFLPRHKAAGNNPRREVTR